MKHITFLVIAVFTLLANSGCVINNIGGGGQCSRGHGYRQHYGSGCRVAQQPRYRGQLLSLRINGRQCIGGGQQVVYGNNGPVNGGQGFCGNNGQQFNPYASPYGNQNQWGGQPQNFGQYGGQQPYSGQIGRALSQGEIQQRQRSGTLGY